MYKRKERSNSEPREITFQKNVMKNAYSSVAVGFGDTLVYCTVSLEHKVPPFLNPEVSGWLTAEYNMLPGSTTRRKSRSIGKQDGRSVEIQRLIGRALRAALNLKKIKGYTLTIDCDVIQADGGTRTAAITGGYYALEQAVYKMQAEGLIEDTPLTSRIASISAGKVDGQVMVDLDYVEDSSAEVDFNVIMNDKGEFIEIQGTAEKGVMSRDDFNSILDYCEEAITAIFAKEDAL